MGGYREFEILVDDVPIASQELENNAPDRFFDAVYPVPKELTRGKSEVTIRFQARPGQWAGGVFGVRTVRAEGALQPPSQAVDGSDDGSDRISAPWYGGTAPLCSKGAIRRSRIGQARRSAFCDMAGASIENRPLETG